MSATDTSGRIDSIPGTPSIDTFSFRFSKDTLDAPVIYEAMDSGVLLVKDKKFILYGNTKTDYKDVTLKAPMVIMDQETNILTAVNSKDSSGNIIARASFTQGAEGFQSDTIRYNFKTQRGLTMNTYTRQDEMFVQGRYIKKIDAVTTFAEHVVMTTCAYDHPHFGFVAKRGKFVAGKIAVTGPIHPEFESVPVPIYLPFGLFPLKQGRHSGILPPQFTVTDQFGIGLTGLGYYHVINDYYDVTLQGDVYSYGGWMANLRPTYRKRYRYEGMLNLSLQRTKLNFKGDPDFRLTKTFNITWSHSVNPKAKPGQTFSANVNIASSQYNELLPNNPNRNFDNQMNSSIAYSKNWLGRPFNLTLTANHSQNNVTRDIRFTLPDAGFTVSTLYPFQRKNAVGTPKWYEKVGVGYNMVARNQVAFNGAQEMTFSKLLDTMQWGAQHRFPINMSLPPIGPLLINPFISYEETWLTHRIGQEWNKVTKIVDTTFDRKGLFIDRRMSFGIGLNTNIYGTKYFKGGKLRAIRHVIRPNVNFNYTPNLSKKYYDVIQVDTSNRIEARPQIVSGRNLFNSYGYGAFGGITFQVDNNVEMKWRGKKDTVDKKVRLIDGFGFSSGYNFLLDSLKLQPFNLYLRTTLFEKISITAQALWNPYQTDTFGRSFNRFVWQGDRFSLGRINQGSIAISTSFQSKPRDANKTPAPTPRNQANTDPTLMADKERLRDYIRRNPAEFVDFNIPWSISLSFSVAFSPERVQGEGFKTRVNSSLNFNNSFSLTPKWNFTTNGFYDFNTMQLSMFTMSISRDMHCWQMSVNVTPIGQYRSFNISLNPKSSILQDLRVNRTRTFYDY